MGTQKSILFIPQALTCRRPSFNAIYEELEPIKGDIVSTQDYGNASLASRGMPVDDPPEERIGKVFRDQVFDSNQFY